MDQKEIGKIFYRDGYRIAVRHLEGETTVSKLKEAIRTLYREVDELLEAFLQRSALEGKPADCKKGCSWCCHQEVFAITHELLYLHDHVLQNSDRKEREGFISRAREKSFLTLHKTLEDQLLVRAPCPFLMDGACAVYASRPMACRIYLSLSAASCKREHVQSGNNKKFPELFEFPLHAGRMMNEGFASFLKQTGMQSAEIPLEQGYASVVTLGQTFESWIG
ncbi:MAG: YkgJ family cysteine cluster protein [Bacteroidota bacterium]